MQCAVSRHFQSALKEDTKSNPIASSRHHPATDTRSHHKGDLLSPSQQLRPLFSTRPPTSVLSSLAARSLLPALPSPQISRVGWQGTEGLATVSCHVALHAPRPACARLRPTHSRRDVKLRCVRVTGLEGGQATLTSPPPTGSHPRTTVARNCHTLAEAAQPLAWPPHLVIHPSSCLPDTPAAPMSLPAHANRGQRGAKKPLGHFVMCSLKRLGSTRRPCASPHAQEVNITTTKTQ
ncbi:hypothetical protein O3P69_002326 [Scylla paramamosain]|uniref:Uncharacterized protein n=1 Tax=Scylla paramamosain TaxID=85552 RepID=A0AAW0V8B7_SCYPA